MVYSHAPSFVRHRSSAIVRPLEIRLWNCLGLVLPTGPAYPMLTSRREHAPSLEMNLPASCNLQEQRVTRL